MEIKTCNICLSTKILVNFLIGTNRKGNFSLFVKNATSKGTKIMYVKKSKLILKAVINVANLKILQNSIMIIPGNLIERNVNRVFIWEEKRPGLKIGHELMRPEENITKNTQK